MTRKRWTLSSLGVAVILCCATGRAFASSDEVAAAVGRRAPAVSRAVDALVKAGFVDRTQDPKNRRRLELRLSEKGRAELTNQPTAGSGLAMRLERLAHSELRAIERAIEILERA